MIQRTWRKIAASAAVALFLSAGCSKKEEAVVETPAAETAPSAEASASAAPPAAPAPAPAAPGSEVLPGASSVRDLMAKKDYETAVGALLALRGAATTPERTQEYMGLYGEVIDTLRVEASSDRKAAQALAQLNLARQGR